MSSICVTGYGHWRPQGECGPLYARAGEALPRVSRKDVLSAPDLSFGRLDACCRLGLLACSRALRDAGLYSLEDEPVRELPGPCGIVAGTVHGCLATDVAYLESCAPENGGLESCSPHHFAYTLPSILLGEAALRFDLRGPAMSLQLSPQEAGLGTAVLAVARDFLRSSAAGAMLAGYCETDPPALLAGELPPAPRGAWFMVLEKIVPASYAS